MSLGRSLSHPPADMGVSGEEPQERDLLLPGKPCPSPTDTPVLATALEVIMKQNCPDAALKVRLA